MFGSGMPSDGQVGYSMDRQVLFAGRTCKHHDLRMLTITNAYANLNVSMRRWLDSTSRALLGSKLSNMFNAMAITAPLAGYRSRQTRYETAFTGGAERRVRF